MKKNIDVFSGLFDKFGRDWMKETDVLGPIKRDLEKFLSSRHKSKSTNGITVASDFGIPDMIWVKNETDRRALSLIIERRIQQMDPRLNKVECEIKHNKDQLNLTVSTNITVPWQREPIHFVMEAG